MTSAIELTDVSKRYGSRAVVNRVSLTVAPGERLALLGHNGAGKTTLMKMILGLVRPDGGRIATLGHEPAGSGLLRDQIGFLPESVVFHNVMTGWEVIRFYARLKRRSAAECHAALERVGLGEAARRRVGTYSKGMRQRLGLAQALLGTPRLLLLDEPTSGLDPELRLSFYAIIRDLADAGTAALLSSHLLTELEERTDRIAIMDHGRLVAIGTLDELRARAGLPVSFRVRISPRDGAETLAQRLGNRVSAPRGDGNGTVLFDCPNSQKMAVLRVLAEMEGAVRDIDIQSPTLDDVYAHFTGAHAGVEEREQETVA